MWGCSKKCVCIRRSTQLCVCVCAFVSMFCFAFCLHLWICVSVCVRENTVRESFDTTAFLSWRHLQPSSNLSVYQAKMLSERLLRQLDNPPHNPPNHHTHTPTPFFLQPSQHKPNNIQRSTKGQAQNHKHPCLFTYTHSFQHSAAASWGSVANTHGGLRCKR